MHFYTYDEIVNELLANFSKETLEFFKTLQKDQLSNFHQTLGQDIRNNFIFWTPGNPLTHGYQDDETKHPDNVSMQIIHTLWEKINVSATESSSGTDQA